ncbi:histidinol dehydrogenase [Candidatus Carsonella ruddii CS isolate Thao2000]|uniref:Histidinol dehydrogenase n=1 Tax=Candidatus Carsonella ruddii CS isolate Thao2000 TaxID=1202537 RepID=J7GWA6_CARRU|nr:histidinol dehydrogenase [Candidatus Carsonella ruddii]AFP83716.1 histidinol dehydrogenase [Candidatus Carsonella ruddii CS isolate Thao2000]
MLNFVNNYFILKKNKKKKDFVLNIINDIKIYGEYALLYYIKKIDGIIIKNINNIKIYKKYMKKAFIKLNFNKKKIIKEIFIRIKKYHFHFYKNSWQIINKNIIYGQKISKIEKICIYIPGGNTIYPSSIFMNAVPSLIHKPKKLIMITPIKNGIISNLILSISYICNINYILLSGGVHTITSVTFGTKNIKKTNKITGPGNKFVTKSKKYLFGNIGIDMLAGPSELFILCEDNLHPKIIINDFFSQLEHDINSISFLLSNNKKYLINIYNNIYKKIKYQKNKKIIFKSLNNSYIIFNNFYNSLKIINFISPEHLMLCVKFSFKLLKKINNCGTIFLNYKTSISYGDYIIGPSHVIPTNKNSKFCSSLNIDDFCKKINIIKTNNNLYSKILSSYFSKKEKFYSHSFSSILR